eukprot:4445815-Amphidinium_carterae.1
MLDSSRATTIEKMEALNMLSTQPAGDSNIRQWMGQTSPIPSGSYFSLTGSDRDRAFRCMWRKQSRLRSPVVEDAMMLTHPEASPSSWWKAQGYAQARIACGVAMPVSAHLGCVELVGFVPARELVGSEQWTVKPVSGYLK